MPQDNVCQCPYCELSRATEARKAETFAAPETCNAVEIDCSAWLEEAERAMSHAANALDAWPEDKSSPAYLKVLKAGVLLYSAVNEARASSTVVFSCREPEQLSTTQGDHDGKH